MAKFKFLSKKKEKFNFIKSKEEIINYEMISDSHIEIFSNKQITVESCKKILDYQENYIKLKLKKGNVIFMGNAFVISDFEDEKIIIKGNISSIEFCV